MLMCCVFILFSLKYFLISLVISSLTFELFKIILFNPNIWRFIKFLSVVDFQFNSIVMEYHSLYHFNPFKKLFYLKKFLSLTRKCKNTTGGTNGYLHAKE